MPRIDSTPPTSPLAATRVWDLPTRVFHGALAASVGGAIVCAEVGGAWMAWHLFFGEAVLSLMIFRLAWGLVGGYWSRFAQFPPSPPRAWRYLRGRPGTDGASVGHNPLGAFSVWGFLLLLSLQVATGLVADDDVDTTGPINAHVGPHFAARASRWHAGYGADLIFALIALHVIAIAWHTWRRREPVLRAMWSGDKPLSEPTRASRDDARSRALALAIWALAAAGVWLMVRWAR